METKGENEYEIIYILIQKKEAEKRKKGREEEKENVKEFSRRIVSRARGTGGGMERKERRNGNAEERDKYK